MSHRTNRKPNPVQICSRKHKGWAFMRSMTGEQYKREEDKIRKDLAELSREDFLMKYETWMY
jgi:hypothetical protein